MRDELQVCRCLQWLKEKAHPVNKKVFLKEAKEREVQGQNFQRYCINKAADNERLRLQTVYNIAVFFGITLMVMGDLLHKLLQTDISELHYFIIMIVKK